MQKPITVFCPITREWAVERFLENLQVQNYPKRLINLVFIVDIDNPRIASDLEKFQQFWEKCERPYRSLHVKINSDWHPDEVHLSIRRMRIADVHNQSKYLIGQTDGEYVIGLEDDTVFEDPETFNRLLDPLNDKVAFVEGVQVGRHGTYYVGAWLVDDPMQVNHIKTLLPELGDDGKRKWEGMRSIDGGGMYGYATPMALYMAHDYFSSSGTPWAVDVNYGIWLRQRGYKCLIDLALLFGHNAHNVILRPDDAVQMVEVNYTRNSNGSGWERKDYENPSSN